MLAGCTFSRSAQRYCTLTLQVRYWDVVVLLLLVFTATVTPFEVSFLDPHLDGMPSLHELHPS